jgi:hypothetical protein
VRELSVIADAKALSADLLVRIVELCQPLCLYLAGGCAQLTCRPQPQVLSVVNLLLNSRARTTGVLLRQWFPLAECVQIVWSDFTLPEFLSLPQQAGPRLRSVEFHVNSTSPDLTLLRPHMSALRTVRLAAYGPAAADALRDLCGELKRAPHLSTLSLRFFSACPDLSGLNDPLAAIPNLTFCRRCEPSPPIRPIRCARCRSRLP